MERPHLLDLAALVISAGFALVAPLQTFLIAYAVIGPFHYLTEIAWLEKKRFYCGQGWVQPRVYAVLSAVLCAAAVADLFLRRGFTAYVVAGLILLSLAALIRNIPLLLAAGALALATRYFLHGASIFFAAFVPTVVHVYLFTLLFLVSGLMRRRAGVLGWMNPLLLLVIPVLLLRTSFAALPAGVIWRASEVAFAPLHTYLAGFLGIALHFDPTRPLDPAAVAVFRVLAFIYLHHYLNWFAKTELLAWHKVSRPLWVGIVAIYAGLLGVYAYSITLGFYVAYFLSLLHVLLELPLDWLAGAAVARGLRTRVFGERQGPATAVQAN